MFKRLSGWIPQLVLRAPAPRSTVLPSTCRQQLVMWPRTYLCLTEPKEEGEGAVNRNGLKDPTGMERSREMEWAGEEREVPLSEQRSLRVAVIGAPNAGKSTLVNQLLQQKVMAVSPKVHTTKRRAMGVFTEGNTQVVLMDTPGIIPSSYARTLHKSREFIADPRRSFMEADLALVLLDAVNKHTREKIDVSILRLLRQHPNLQSILVLNKTDIVKVKSVLLKLAEVLTGSDDSYQHEIGYLVRKWRDNRLSPRARMEARRKIDQLEAELVRRKEAKLLALETLKAKAAEREGRGEELGMNAHIHPEVENSDAEEVEETSTTDHAHSPVQATPNTTAAPRPQEIQDIMPNHWPYFDDVFMISALEGDGIPKLKQYFLDCAKHRPWEYSESAVTDLPAITLVQDIIHEKICLHFNKELPYVVRQENVIWERDDRGMLNIYQYLYCGKKSRLRMLIGHKGKMIQQIRDEAEEDIEELLKCPVDLTLDVKK